jgi:hypothetical protein
MQAKAAITVKEMANLVGLSRDRFYDGVKSGVFPPPLYRVDTHRPLYSAELQAVCLEVRRTGLGFNGQPVVFNQTARSKKLSRRFSNPLGADQQQNSERSKEIAAKLRYLGIRDVTEAAIADALKKCLAGIADQLDESAILQRLVRYFSAEKGKRGN